MQLKHIEHPEDTILTGDLSAINWFTIQGKVSVSYTHLTLPTKA